MASPILDGRAPKAVQLFTNDETSAKKDILVNYYEDHRLTKQTLISHNSIFYCSWKLGRGVRKMVKNKGGIPEQPFLRSAHEYKCNIVSNVIRLKAASFINLLVRVLWAPILLWFMLLLLLFQLILVVMSLCCFVGCGSESANHRT